MILRERDLIERAIDEGLACGLRRAYKYDDRAKAAEEWDETARATLLGHVMAALDEIVAAWAGDTAIQGAGPELK
jgi:hypothetical protein